MELAKVAPPPSTPRKKRSPRRGVMVTFRLSVPEHTSLRAKASAAGVSLSSLLRAAIVRTRTWMAAATDVERARTRQLARIGNNLNQIARWANRHKSAADAVAVIAHLVAIERELRSLSRRGGPDS